MSGKIETQKGCQPRLLTASEIRSRVEDLAEVLAQRMRSENGAAETQAVTGLEAFPLDNRKFIRAMSGFIQMN